MVSEMLTPGQHNNVPKQTVETKDTKDTTKTKTESVRRLSSQMELGGRQDKEPSHSVYENDTKRGAYVVMDLVVVVAGADALAAIPGVRGAAVDALDA